MLSNYHNIEKLKECGAIEEGHFILSSGLHSKYYIQCAKIFLQPTIAHELCAELIKKLKINIDLAEITTIVSPAMGGVLVGYEIARQLNKKNIFCERVNGNFELRRGFNLTKDDKVLVVEDVITTGKSSIETYNCIKKYGAQIVAEASIIKRDKNLDKLNGVNLISLIDIEIPSYLPDNIPAELKSIDAIKPGSRFLKK